MRKAVVFCLIDNRRRVLLERKSSNHPNEPGRLVFPGGLVEFGESILEAIRRELREEYAIDDSQLIFLKLFEDPDYASPGGRRFHVSYFVVLGWNGVYSELLGVGPSELYDPEKAMRCLNSRRQMVLEMALNIYDHEFPRDGNTGRHVVSV